MRLGISSEASGTVRPTGREFLVSFQNAGDSDFVLNLGFMLANGKVMFPSAVQLILTDPAGKRRELETAGARVGGRMDDFTVALRTGSTYLVGGRVRPFGSCIRCGVLGGLHATLDHSLFSSEWTGIE